MTEYNCPSDDLLERKIEEEAEAELAASEQSREDP